MVENLKRCPFCAEEIHFEAIKCKHCGESLDKSPPSKIIEHRISTPLRQTHALGVVSFVLAILGLFTSFFFPFAIQIIGIILGHIANSDIKSNPDKYTGGGLVTAGLIINYFIIVISLLFWAFLGVGLAIFFSSLA